jgi:ectoine hydroxylase
MTQQPTVATAMPMTAEQRAAFDRDGYVIIRGALDPDEVAAAREAIDRVYARMAKAGSLGPDGSMHLLSAVANCPEVAGLTDHPATFPYVWSTLGWNIHIYHSHLDVHPPVGVHMPFRFEWHQDGGRQNREIETTPRPRLSVKLAYWLSDVSQPQLLGGTEDAGGDHAWGHDPATTPLHGWLNERGFLDPANPPLRP